MSTNYGNNTNNNSRMEMASRVFPYRNPDGSPAYWHYQRDVVEKTLTSFDLGKRCVVIDAPVGSGKSVINYTILKCLGPSVYITAQKSLQDQIDNEDWPGVKSVKGRNAYTCNYALRKGIDHSCDIKYEDISGPTCNEMIRYNYEMSNNMYASLVDSILKALDETKGDRAKRRSRSSFVDSKELFSTITKIEAMAAEQGIDSKKLFIKSVACNINPVECPVKSARLMARMSDIAVVNPDAYYALNKAMKLFEGRKYMVVDEAHRLDDAVQRLFRIQLPLGVFNDCFGINLNSLAALTSVEDFCKQFQVKLKTEIWPIVAAFKCMEGIEECFSIHNLETSNDTRIQNKEIEAHISKGARDLPNGFCLLSVFIDAIKGDNLESLKMVDQRYASFQGFYDYIRTIFTEKCEAHGCEPKFDMDEYFMPKMVRYLRKVDKFISKFDNIAIRHQHAQKVSYSNIQAKTANHLSNISETIESAIYVLDGMVRSKFGENRVFVKQLVHTTKEKACVGTEYAKFYHEFEYDKDEPEAVLDIIPLHIGCLLQNFIFKGMEAVVLSSGTWPDPVGMLVGYGFKKAEMEVLRIKPIFPAKNRPIYINTNTSWTDFSQKAEGQNGPTYVYQTEAGAKKFCGELHKLRSYLRQKHGGEINIAIHCFNYGISKLIAEYYPGIDESFLIHLPRVKEVINKTNGYTMFRLPKDVLIDRFCKNPKSGFTLVSPSILEGLDFKNDICRAQIILKAPIPNLGDPYNSYKFNGCPEINLRPDRMFLDRKCAIDLNQAYGRNVRGMEDWGETYIVDLALTKRMAKAFGVHVDGLDNDAPGNMGKLNMLYIKQGTMCSKDEYGRFKFKWPI
jgi:hypothetical protein